MSTYDSKISFGTAQKEASKDTFSSPAPSRYRLGMRDSPSYKFYQKSGEAGESPVDRKKPLEPNDFGEEDLENEIKTSQNPMVDEEGEMLSNDGFDEEQDQPMPVPQTNQKSAARSPFRFSENGGSLDSSLVILRKQLSQIEKIKSDNVKKDQKISELTTVLNDFSQIRTEAEKVSNENEELKQQIQETEQEAIEIKKKLQNELEGLKENEKKTMQKIEELNSLLVDEKTKNARIILDLEKKIQALEKDKKKTKEESSVNETQLEKLKAALDEQESLTKKKQGENLQMMQTLEKQLDSITRSKNTLQNRLTELEAVSRQTTNSLNEKNEEIKRCRDEIEMLEKEKQNQSQTIGSLEGILESTKLRLHELSLKANMVPDLQSQANQVPLLKNEIDHLKDKNLEYHNELKNFSERLEEMQMEKEKLYASNGEYEQEIDGLKKENEILLTRSDELNERTKQNEQLEKDNNFFKTKIAALEKQLFELKGKNAEKESDSKDSVEDIVEEINGLQNVIQSALSGERQVETDFSSNNPEVCREIAPILSCFVALRTKVVDTLLEISNLREKLANAKNEIESLKEKVIQQKTEKNDVVKQLMEAREMISKQEKEISHDQSVIEKSQKMMSEMEERLTKSSEEENRRVKFAQNLFWRLCDAEPSQQASKKSPSPKKEEEDGEESEDFEAFEESIEDDTVEDLQKSKENEQIETSSWEAFQVSLSDKVNKVVIESNKVKRKLHFVEKQLTGTRKLLEKNKQRLKESWDQMEKEKMEAQKNKNSEMENQRKEMEKIREATIDRAQKKAKQDEEEIKNLKNQTGMLENQSKQMNIVQTILRNDIKGITEECQNFEDCIFTLARGIRPLKQRINDLKIQKNFIKMEKAIVEKNNQQILDMINKLSSEIENKPGANVLPPKKRKTSFRTAGIAILAFNRMKKIMTAQNKMEIKLDGEEVVRMLPACEIEKDTIPSLAVNKSSNSFPSIYTILDPKIKFATTPNYTLVKNLKKGYDNMKNKLLTKKQSKKAKNTADLSQFLFIADEAVQIQSAQQQINKIIEQAKKIESEKSGIQKQFTHVSEQALAIQGKNKELEQQLEKKSEMMDYLTNSIAKLQKENSGLIQPKRVAQLEEEIKNLQESYKTVSQEKEQFRRELEGNVNILNELRQQNQDLENQLREKEEKIETLKHELNANETKKKQFKMNLMQMKNDISELESEKEKYKRISTELQQSVQNALNKKLEEAEGSQSSFLSSNITETPKIEQETQNSSSSITENDDFMMKFERELAVHKSRMQKLEKKANTFRGMFNTPTPATKQQMTSSAMISGNKQTTPFGSVSERPQPTAPGSSAKVLNAMLQTLSLEKDKANQEIESLDKEIMLAKSQLESFKSNLL